MNEFFTAAELLILRGTALILLVVAATKLIRRELRK